MLDKTRKMLIQPLAEPVRKSVTLSVIALIVAGIALIIAAAR